MRFPLNWYLATLSVLCICVPLANGQVKRPALTDSELLALVAGNELSESIVQQMKSRGLAFRPNEQYETLIQTAGGDAALITALRNARIADSGQSTESNASREQLLEHLAAGGRLIRSKQYQKAEQELTSALQSGGGAEVGFVMGESLREQEQWPEAAAVYTEVLRRSPDLSEAHTKLSYINYRMGHRQEALRQAQAALAHDPENAEAHKNAGLAFQIMERFAASEQEYREALRIKPDYAAVHEDLGILFFRQGAWDQAIEEYKKAMVLAPSQGDLHFKMGLAYEKKSDLNSAIREYREAKRLDPKMTEARQNLGNALMQSGLNAEAVVEMRELEAMAPDSAMCHECLATALLGTQDLQGAEKEYRKAIELDPSDAYPHLGLGNVRESQKDYDGALQEFRESEHLAPSDVRAHRNAARILLGKKDLPGALEELKRAEFVGPSDAETHDLHGQALEMSGDHTGAITQYRQALALYTKFNPKQSGIRLRLAAALEKNQDWVEALDEYRRAAVADFRPDTQAQYKAAKQRLDARIAAMKASGNSAGAAEVKTELRNSIADPRISEKVDAAMLAGREASQTQRFDEAEKSYKEAADLAEKLQPHDDRLTISLMHLGGLYQGRKDSKLAEATFQRYLKASEELYGAESPQMTQPLQILGLYELANHNYTAALDYDQRAVDINQKAFGEGSQPVAMALSSLASVYTEEKAYDKAESYLLRAVHIDEGLFGRDGWGVSFPLWYLCVLYDKWGKSDKAEPCYEQDLAVNEHQFGPDNPVLLQVLTNQAKALRALGRTEEAGKVEKRAESIRAASPGPNTLQPSGPPPFPY
jgi:tetratricopeptide (TPR) repeat protein